MKSDQFNFDSDWDRHCTAKLIMFLSQSPGRDPSAKALYPI